jgi:non-heme chloroperoxidase
MLPPETDLHVESLHPRRPSGRSILFVHGAYTNLWCWQPYFLPYFADRGFAAHALSLRGHGRSGGAGTLFAASLDDYAADVARVAASLDQPPILVGHSMGATVVERALLQIECPAAVLLAPVPPTGLVPALHELMTTRPDLLIDFQQLEAGHPTPAALEALRPLYFTDRVQPNLLWDMVLNAQPESERALLDLSLRWDGPVASGSPPVLVVAPALDRLFPPASVQQTALRYGSDAVVLAGLPHMLMLDDGWESAAAQMASWLERVVPVR